MLRYINSLNRQVRRVFSESYEIISSFSEEQKKLAPGKRNGFKIEVLYVCNIKIVVKGVPIMKIVHRALEKPIVGA